MPAGPDLKVKRAVNPGRGAKIEVNRGLGRLDTPETPYHTTQPPSNQVLRPRPREGLHPAPVLTCPSQSRISKLNIQPFLPNPPTLSALKSLPLLKNIGKCSSSLPSDA